MYKICFVCLGNICRSPLAEFILKDLLHKRNLEKNFLITSRATSYEEEGNDLYPPIKKLLAEKQINFSTHHAKRLEKSDYFKYDYFIGMDDNNITDMLNIFGQDKENKISKLLNRNIKDPWYTGDFERAYEDIYEGLKNLLIKFNIY